MCTGCDTASQSGHTGCRNLQSALQFVGQSQLVTKVHAGVGPRQYPDSRPHGMHPYERPPQRPFHAPPAQRHPTSQPGQPYRPRPQQPAAGGFSAGMAAPPLAAGLPQQPQQPQAPTTHGLAAAVDLAAILKNVQVRAPS